MVKKKRLGRGLSALIETDIDDLDLKQETGGKNLISINEISISKFQTRKKFDEEKLKELSSKLQFDEEVEDNNLEITDDNNNKFNKDSSEDDTIEENNKTRKRIDHKKNYLNFFRKYKIQDVIKPRQVILVQINKEERGFKGAALTTFLSFAGRYCVLMPNSLNKDGISRKIGDFEERKKLKKKETSNNSLWEHTPRRQKH